MFLFSVFDIFKKKADKQNSAAELLDWLNLKTPAEIVNDVVVNGAKIQIANIFKTFFVVKM